LTPFQILYLGAYGGTSFTISKQSSQDSRISNSEKFQICSKYKIFESCKGGINLRDEMYLSNSPKNYLNKYKVLVGDTKGDVSLDNFGWIQSVF